MYIRGQNSTDSVRNHKSFLDVLSAAAVLFFCDRAQFGQGAIHASAVDVPVGHHAYGKERGILRPDSFWVECVAKFDSRHASSLAVKNHNIAADTGGIDFQTRNLGDAFGQVPSVLMVFV